MADEWVGSEVLVRAAELVAEGWTQGVSAGLGADGRYLSVDSDEPADLWSPTGAIEWAAMEILGDDYYHGSDHGIAALAIWLQSQGALPSFHEADVAKLQDDWWNAIVDWNDAPGRSAAEVVGALLGGASLGRVAAYVRVDD